MPKKYTSEQFWKLYEKLPQELKDALFAEETGNNIYDICKRNEIEENLEQIVDYVGQVLVGVLPPEELQVTLEKELNLDKEIASLDDMLANSTVSTPNKSKSLDDFLSEKGKSNTTGTKANAGNSLDEMLSSSGTKTPARAIA